MARRSGSSPGKDRALSAILEGERMAAAHPMLARMADATGVDAHSDASMLPEGAWAQIDVATGDITVDVTRVAHPLEWAWVFAHLMLHLGFGHGDPDDAFGDHLSAMASDVVVCRFQRTMGFGRPPIRLPDEFPPGSESALAARWVAEGIPPGTARCGVAGDGPCVIRTKRYRSRADVRWGTRLALGLTDAVAAAVDVAGGARRSLYESTSPMQPWDRARNWFLSAHPLLGATMASLTVVADAELARGWDIPVAAVNPVVGELYINPLAHLSEDEWRFVLAHEALHAALSHHTRTGGRDPYLFNLATDFVINGWLVEMGIGAMPSGLLYDPQFAGASSEEVYDRIAVEARRYRKLATLRGRAAPDIVEQGGRLPAAGAGAGVDLDELLRRSLASGLDIHLAEGRGLIPAGLVAEIRALAQPPLRWDVELARWFEELFPALEPTRTYARASRRQAATPDIPRPGWVTPDVPTTVRTFGVVLDTSASMSAELLGKALGAIAAYARAHDVPAVRLVHCDAVAYDAGYVDVDDIAGRVRVRGRGGTRLQPAVELLERAHDFPPDGPILLITDGEIDVLRIRRSHAFLLPAGRSLPFRPKGPVFRFE